MICQIIVHLVPHSIVYAFTALAIILVFAGFFFLWKRHTALQYVFLYFAIITVIACAFFIMPFQNMDEQAHFERSYAISEGDLLGQGNKYNWWGSTMPRNIFEFFEYFSVSDTTNQKLSLYDTTAKLEINYEDISFSNYVNAAVFAPTNYMFQGIGIFLTRLFTKNILTIYYGGRLFYSAVLILIFFAAISLVPQGKPLFLALCVSATAIQFRNAYSSDGLAIALIFLLLAFVLNKAANPNGRMKRKDYILMYTLLVFITLSKNTYVLSVLLLFLIPWKQFGTRKNYIRNIFLSAGLVAVLFIGWILLAFPVQHVYQAALTWNVSSSDQIQYILSHPSVFFKIFINYFDSEYILNQSFGVTASWADLQIGCNLSFLAFLLVIAAVFYDNEKAPELLLSKGQRALLLLIAVGSALLISAALYTTWASVHAVKIDGLQPRYFFPLLPLLCFALKPAHPLKINRMQELVFEGTALGVMCCVLVTLMAAVL